MAFCGRTIAVAKQLGTDIRKILFVVTILVNCIFFVFYGYSIYVNIENTLYLVIYSLLAAATIVNFITYLATRKKEKDKNINVFARIVRIFRYIVNASFLAVSIYQMVQFGATDFNKVLLIVSAVALIIQVAVELIRIFIERYIELFTTSIKMDFALLEKLSKITQVRGNLAELAESPVEALANMLSGKAKEEAAVSETQQYIDQLAKQYNAEAEEKKAAQKAKNKQDSKDNAEKQKEELFDHLKIIKDAIFKKKK